MSVTIAIDTEYFEDADLNIHDGELTGSIEVNMCNFSKMVEEQTDSDTLYEWFMDRFGDSLLDGYVPVEEIPESFPDSNTFDFLDYRIASLGRGIEDANLKEIQYQFYQLQQIWESYKNGIR